MGVAFALPEPADPAERGANNPYDQVHLGVGAASLGSVCVGVYGLWHSQAFGEDFARINCDLGLVASNDGIHFREPGATPVSLPEVGGELRVNADGVAGLAVDLLDDRLQPIPGFAGGTVTGPDGLDCPVRWQGYALTERGGQRVRVQVRL